MAAKRGWFSLVKRLLGLGRQTKLQKEKRRRKWLCGRLYIQRLAPLAAPAPSVTLANKEGDVGLVEESNHALSVALAAAAAAEAAISPAHAAAKVVKFTGTSPGSKQWKREADARTTSNIHAVTVPATLRIEQQVQESSAVKIQTVFRGFLARKALRALKGIVKLQAIIRGRAVRRQAMTTLRRLQSIVDIHSQVCATRSHVLRVKTDFNDHYRIKHIVGKEVKGCYRRWDDSLLSREDVKALLTSKREAAVRRERIKEYAFSHRKSAESENRKPQGRWRYWLEQWVDTQLSRSREFEDLDPVLASNTEEPGEHARAGSLKQTRRYQQRPRNKLEASESPSPSPQSATRRHLLKYKRRCSHGEDFSGIPALPTYMAATASAKAKARSSSSPNIRPGAFDAYSESPNIRPGAFDAYSESPNKSKISLVSSMASEVTSIKLARSGETSGPRQRSPSLRCHSVPSSTKSSRIPSHFLPN